MTLNKEIEICNSCWFTVEIVYCLHFYTGIVLIEKRIMQAPRDVRKGKLTVGYIEYTEQKNLLLFKS